MRRRHSLLVGLMLIAATSAFSLPGLSDPPTRSILPSTTVLPAQTKKGPAVRDLGRLPLAFESNQGQTDAKVRFLTHSGDSTLFLTPSEAVFTMPAQSVHPSTEQASLRKDHSNRRAMAKIAHVALRMQMVGANPGASVLQQQPLAGRINYFIGKDPSKWRAGVPTFGRVGFHQVYPGIDLVYYGNQRHLEYDFVVAPHADPNQIKLHFAGAQGVRVNAVGDLIVRTQGRELKWQKPMVYQQDATGKHSVTARFQLKRLPNGQAGVRFALGRYDTARSLVIDPMLLYSTYLGGSNGGPASGIAVDSSGNAYVTGDTSATDFPTTSGAFQLVRRGGVNSYNVFVTKFNSAGTALIYSTYLGGSTGNGDLGTGIAVDSSGNAYVTGLAGSSDFPTTPGALQQTHTSSSNAFVTKLNPSGTALVYSTYLGGSSSNGERANGIALDNGGNAYVTGYTYSADFPTTSGAFQTVKNSGSSVYTSFVSKLNPSGTALVYSTYLGGSSYDQARSIGIDSSGNAFVAGSAGSADFPTTPNAFQQTKAANYAKVFVTKFNSTGTALIYSTYLGGSADYSDDIYGIVIDRDGDAYVTGYTYSADFPTTNGAFQRVNNGQVTSSPNVFVTKCNADGTALVYSTLLGGSGAPFGFGDQATGIAIDGNGNAYVTGYTASPDFPTTVGAFQRVKKGGKFSANAFVAQLNPGGTALVYSTYLGGSGPFDDQARGIAIDSSGNTHIAGYASSTDFPTTLGAFQRVNKGGSGIKSAFVTSLSTVPIFPDFNNDGFVDLLLQNASTNAILGWFMQGSTFTGSANFSLNPPSDYTLVGAGDFGLAGLGITTLVFQSNTTNQVIYWYTGGANNATVSGGDYVNVTPQAGWKLVGVGDFNADGKSDLVFQSQTTNQVAIWFMSGPYYQGGVLMPYTPPTGWTVAGVGDFNADGQTDIAFQNQSTGQIALWYMNGPTYAGGTVLSTIPASGWKVVGVGDYNGDGSADLLFQNQASNQAAVWYLTNGVFAGGAVLSLTPPSGWKIVGPR